MENIFSLKTQNFFYDFPRRAYSQKRSAFFNLWFFLKFFWNSSTMLLVAPALSAFAWKIFFFKNSKFMIFFSLFSCSVYSAVSVLSTNKLVHNISTCNPSVMFVSNHCYTTILMYPHFLVYNWVPYPINQSTCNQSIFKFLLVYFLSTPSFIGFMSTFYSRIQSFHALTPAGATVVHKSNSFNPELKCRLCRLRFLSGCIRSR